MKIFANRNSRHPTLIRSVIAALLLSVSCVAWSADLGQLKAQGIVGEKLDGYLQLMNPGAGQDVKNLVAGINAQRNAAYTDIAKKNKISAEQVGKLTAPKAMASSPAGTPIQTPNGWKRK